MMTVAYEISNILFRAQWFSPCYCNNIFSGYAYLKMINMLLIIIMLELELLNVNKPLLPSHKALNEKPAGSVYLVGQFIFLRLSNSPEVVSACIKDPFLFPINKT